MQACFAHLPFSFCCNRISIVKRGCRLSNANANDGWARFFLSRFSFFLSLSHSLASFFPFFPRSFRQYHEFYPHPHSSPLPLSRTHFSLSVIHFSFTCTSFFSFAPTSLLPPFGNPTLQRTTTKRHFFPSTLYSITPWRTPPPFSLSEHHSSCATLIVRLTQLRLPQQVLPFISW